MKNSDGKKRDRESEKEDQRIENDNKSFDKALTRLLHDVPLIISKDEVDDTVKNLSANSEEFMNPRND